MTGIPGPRPPGRLAPGHGPGKHGAACSDAYRCHCESRSDEAISYFSADKIEIASSLRSSQ